MGRIFLLLFICLLRGAFAGAPLDLDQRAFQEAMDKCVQIEALLPQIEAHRGDSSDDKNRFIQLIVEKNELCDELSLIFLNRFMVSSLKERDPFLERKLVALYEIFHIIDRVKNSTQVSNTEALKFSIGSFEQFIQSEKPTLQFPYQDVKPSRVYPRYFN